ncbi:MAG: allantoate amidohydrolase [Janthinobacterium lividum]
MTQASLAPQPDRFDHEAFRLGEPLMARLAHLAAFTSTSGSLTRLFLTPAHKAAAEQVAAWMRDAGLQAGIDAIGNVVGRTHPDGDGRPVLLLGSHIDTVRQAGRYDGAFGVLAAVAALAELRDQGEALPFAVEVIAFGDEEGVRFPVTMTGSRAVAGCFDPAALDAADAEGVSLRDALAAFGCDPGGIPGVSRAGRPVLGYIEAHIEQGPVLEAQNLPLGIVTGIAGATRLRAVVTGTAGHAGTVPMSMRHDALVAAAGMVMAVEHVAASQRGLVATVGQMLVQPGAPNSIPGEVEFTVDIRAGHDAIRLEGVAAIQHAIRQVGSERGVGVQCQCIHDAPAVACAPALQSLIQAAIEGLGVPPLHLASGAGHDAMTMARLCPVGMLFTRCWRGISHNPAESILATDAGLTVLALCALLRAYPGASEAAR